MPGGRSSGSASTCCCRTPGRSRPPTCATPRGSTEATLTDLVAALPDAWLPDDPLIGDAEAQRRAYVRYLTLRLEAPRPFVEEADRARAAA